MEGDARAARPRDRAGPGPEVNTRARTQIPGPPGLRPPSPFAGPTRVARRALREAAAARRERSAGPAVVPAAGPAFNVASLTRASMRAGACRTPRRFRRPRRRVPAAR